jgi:hypothetical protein
MGTLGVVVSRDGRRIVNGAEDGKITTWDVERKIIGVLSRLIFAQRLSRSVWTVSDDLSRSRTSRIIFTGVGFIPDDLFQTRLIM